MKKLLFFALIALCLGGCFAIVEDREVSKSFLIKEEDVLTILELADEEAPQGREIIIFK